MANQFFHSLTFPLFDTLAEDIFGWEREGIRRRETSSDVSIYLVKLFPISACAINLVIELSSYQIKTRKQDKKIRLSESSCFDRMSILSFDP